MSFRDPQPDRLLMSCSGRALNGCDVPQSFLLTYIIHLTALLPILRDAAALVTDQHRSNPMTRVVLSM
jgi:hypothetical protein